MDKKAEIVQRAVHRKKTHCVNCWAPPNNRYTEAVGILRVGPAALKLCEECRLLFSQGTWEVLAQC